MMFIRPHTTVNDVFIYVTVINNRISQIDITKDDIPSGEVALNAYKYGPYYDFKLAVYQLQTEIVHYYNG